MLKYRVTQQTNATSQKWALLDSFDRRWYDKLQSYGCCWEAKTDTCEISGNSEKWKQTGQARIGDISKLLTPGIPIYLRSRNSRAAGPWWSDRDHLCCWHAHLEAPASQFFPALCSLCSAQLPVNRHAYSCLKQLLSWVPCCFSLSYTIFFF